MLKYGRVKEGVEDGLLGRYSVDVWVDELQLGTYMAVHSSDGGVLPST